MKIKVIGKGGASQQGRLTQISPSAKKVNVQFSKDAARIILLNSAPLDQVLPQAQGIENGHESQAQSAKEINRSVF